jgi:adenosine deaminase
MPKGGDLHHHFGGSVYAEYLLQWAIDENLWLDTESMNLAKVKGKGDHWLSFSEIQEKGLLETYKIKILSRWSVKDYYSGLYPSDKLFFESFDKFWPALQHHFAEGLLEIKNRAIKENVSYIETQLSPVHNNMDVTDLNSYNLLLRKAAKQHQDAQVLTLLKQLYAAIIQKGAAEQALQYNSNFVEHLHDSLRIDNDTFTMRYQNFVLRFMEPVELFKNLVLGFMSAEKSKLIVGVNIVSPEDGDVSMKDYHLHMLMYKFCHQQFPTVQYSMHAGELTLGLVQPEELTWHINEAVRVAGANRIGHGVDMAYEQKSYDLLRYMHKNNIAVEINLTSNEFILKVKDKEHPLTLYRAFQVPCVISTDDMAVLRSNHTRQFVLLAKRYPEISYAAIKEMVFNSLEYSFIKEPALKNKLMHALAQRFKVFEAGLPR